MISVTNHAQLNRDPDIIFFFGCLLNFIVKYFETTNFHPNNPIGRIYTEQIFVGILFH